MLAFLAVGIGWEKRDVILRREGCPSPPTANLKFPDLGSRLGAQGPFLEERGMEADKETVPGPGSKPWSQKGSAEKDASLCLPTNSKISKTRRSEPLRQMPAKQSAFGEERE